MQCDDVRAQLSSLRPDSRDADQEEFAPVMAHVQQCADCQSYWEIQQQSDRDLGRAIRNVSIPTDFKARLLAQLSAAIEPPVATPAATEAVTAEIALPTTTVQPLPRTRPADHGWTRRRAATVVSAALLLLAFGSWFFLNTPRQVQLSVEQLVAISQTPESFPDRFPYQSSAYVLPTKEIQTPTFEGKDWGVQIVRYEGQDIGMVVPYSVRFLGQKKVQEVVLMIVTLDPHRITIPDLSKVGTSFTSAHVTYPAPNFYATRVWQDGRQLYVCFVKSKDANDLERLRLSKVTA